MDTYKNVFKYIVQKIKNNDYSDELPFDIASEYYTFTKNFFNYIGVSEYSELLDYGNQALEYIDKTFPYCFMRLDNKNVDEAIKLYVLSLGGTIEQVPIIIERLKNTKMKHISKQEIRDKIESLEMYDEEEYISIDNVIGTSVSKYQQDNLYDILVAINDKNINSYIHYLVLNNIFNDEKHFQKVFNGTSHSKDEEGNIYINEGNHRIFTYLSLLKIREFLNIDSNSKNYKVTTLMYKPVEVYENTKNNVSK